MGILVKNGNVVFPNRFVRKVDLLISDGLISKIGIDIEEEGDQVVEASGKYVFPGVIDSHFHAGIYRPLPLDARSESASAVAGGVTTLLSYFRTGRYYMNSSAPYTTLFKEVLKQSEGNYYTDYGYHLAPITRKHLEEMPYLTREYGIATSKSYMFLRGIDASGPRNEDPSKGYLLSADPYDLGHLQKVMTQVARIRQEIGTIRLSIHAEDSRAEQGKFRRGTELFRGSETAGDEQQGSTARVGAVRPDPGSGTRKPYRLPDQHPAPVQQAGPRNGQKK